MQVKDEMMRYSQEFKDQKMQSSSDDSGVKTAKMTIEQIKTRSLTICSILQQGGVAHLMKEATRL